MSHKNLLRRKPSLSRTAPVAPVKAELMRSEKTRQKNRCQHRAHDFRNSARQQINQWCARDARIKKKPHMASSPLWYSLTSSPLSSCSCAWAGACACSCSCSCRVHEFMFMIMCVFSCMCRCAGACPPAALQPLARPHWRPRRLQPRRALLPAPRPCCYVPSSG